MVPAPHPLAPEGRRFLFYTNECVGLGHLRRTMNLAEAVTRTDPDASALVITGAGAVLSERRHPRIDTVKLPEFSRDPAGSLQAARLGLDTDQLHTLRAQLAAAAAESFAPSVAVVDKTPLGLNDELLPALEALRGSEHTKLVLGLRDIEDAPDVVRRRWADVGLRETIDRLYDTVLVYGPAPPDADADEHGLVDLDIPVHHVGYVGAPLPSTGPSDLAPGYLLVTTGGGADGFPVFDAVLAALAVRPADVPVVLVTGPLMPALARAEVHARGEALGIQVIDFRDDMPAVIAGSRAVITMAGYNTISEVLRAGKPTLVVPRTAPSREQLIRATALAESGAAEMLDISTATPATMADAIARLLLRPAPGYDATLHDGANRTARILCALAAGSHHPDTASTRMPAVAGLGIG